VHPSLSPPFSSKRAPFSNQRAIYLIKRALYSSERALFLTRRDSPGLCTGCSTRSLVLHPSNLISRVFQYHRLSLTHGHTQGAVCKMTIGYDGRGRSSIAFQKSLKFCQKSPIFVRNEPCIVSICLLARCCCRATFFLTHTLSPTHKHAPETAEGLFGLYHPLTHNLFHIRTHTRGAAAEGRCGMTAED